MSKKGFTLIELMVTISIIAVLSVVGLASYKGIQSKAKDSIRKNDLTKLATALEIYFQREGNGKYVLPAGTGPESCDRDTTAFYAAIASYIPDSIVDPQTKANYCYVSVNNGQSYTLCAKLENNTSDVNNPAACPGYNYGVTPK